MSGSSIKNLRLFRKLCGDAQLSKVCLLTTMWDKVTPQVGSGRETQLQEGFWSSMIARGSSIRRHDRGVESARDVVRSMLDNEPTSIKLQDEMASGKTLIQTEAGICINEEILKLQEQHKEELNDLKEEMGLAMAQGMYLQSHLISVTNPSPGNQKLQAQLRAEYAQKVSQIEQRAEQQNKLAQTQIHNLERRWQDSANELHASVARERELQIAAREREFQIAARDRERFEQEARERERELQIAARDRERFEQEARQRERFEPVRWRDEGRDRSFGGGAERGRDGPNTVRARHNSAPEPYQGLTWSETKRKRENHNGQPYKTFQCYVPKTWGSSGCGRPFDVVNPTSGKVQCCYCRKNWTIWGRANGRLR